MNNFYTQQHTEKGAAVMLFVLFFMFASVAVVLLVTSTVYSALQVQRLVERSAQTYYSTEGAIEEVAYRLRNADPLSATETNTLFGVNTEVSYVSDVLNGFEIVSATGTANNLYRHLQVVLGYGFAGSFQFGMQGGNGGITMSNNSQVIGDVFANGSVIGVNTGANGSHIYGNVISSGLTGYIERVHATGSVWAHELRNTYVEGNAYYAVDTASTILGDRTVTSNDQPDFDMPIPDSVIYTIEDLIQNGGTVIASTSPDCSSGTYEIDTDTTIGNLKVECDLEISKNNTDLILTGPVWVEGNITFSQGPTLYASSTLGSRSVVLIAHDRADETTSSQVIIQQSTDFNGSGDPRSYVILVAMNNDEEMGGSEDGIIMSNSAQGQVLLYAPHGSVTMSNNLTLNEVTGFLIELSNGSEVIYESGLSNILVDGGPNSILNFFDWNEI